MHVSLDTSGDTRRQQLVAQGIKLFNQQQFWHAHEAWEQVWLQAVEPEASFYKGLIQAAAALVHWQRGNLRGLHLNWAKARPRLIASGSTARPVNTAELIATMDRFVDADGRDVPIPQLSRLFPEEG